MNINLKLTDVSEEEIYALANFLKRIGTAEYRQNAESDKEAQQIATAVCELRNALGRAGFEVW